MRNDPFYHQSFDFQLYTEKLYTLPARCPGMHLFSAGESVLGKPLWCLFAGDPAVRRYCWQGNPRFGVDHLHAANPLCGDAG